METLKNLWKRIEKWHRDNLPEALIDEWEREEFLSTGADAAAIAAVETVIGLEFPTDLKASYLLHDGSRNQYSILPWSYYLLSLNEIMESCRMMHSAEESGVWTGFPSEPKGPIRPVHWNTRWIPISHNGGGDHQCVDLDPASGGTVGQVIRFSHEVGPEDVLATGFKAWLSEYVADLEAGRYTYDPIDWSVTPVGEGQSE